MYIDLSHSLFFNDSFNSFNELIINSFLWLLLPSIQLPILHKGKLGSQNEKENKCEEHLKWS